MSSGGALTELVVDDHATETMGAVSVPALTSFARASIANVMLSANTMLSGGVTANQLRVGRYAGAGTQGALYERATTPIGPPRNWRGSVTGGSWDWPQAYSGSAGTLTANNTAGIDGLTLAAKIVTTANTDGFGAYTGNLQWPGYPARAAMVFSFFAKAGAQTQMQYHADGGTTDPAPHGQHATVVTLTSAWARQSLAWAPYGNGPLRIAIPDGRNHSADSSGGVAAFINDCYIDVPMHELGTYGTTYQAYGTPRAGDERSIDSAASVAPDGRIRFDVTFVPIYGSVTLGLLGDVYANRRLWTLDRDTYVEIDGRSQRLVAVVGGVVCVFDATMVWAAGDAVRIRVDCGNGMPSASFGVNGAALSSLGTTGAVTQPYIRTEDARLDLYCDATSGTAISQIDAYVQKATFYTGKARAPSGSTYYASPSGSGSGTKASPASLAAARALATSGDTVILRGGTYRQTSTLAVTAASNGVTFANYPRETPIISGQALLSGTWAVHSGSVYKLTGVAAIQLGQQLFVNGVRSNLASLTIASPATWAITGSGFTAPDTSISLLARPNDVVVEWLHPWRHGLIPLTGVSGATLTANATALANAQSWTGNPIVNTQLYKLRNALEWVTAAGDYYYDAGSSTLYYYIRPGDVMASAVVEVGAVDTLMSVSGTLAAKATGITFRGITFEGSRWTGARSPANIGYAEMQGGVEGQILDYFGVHGTYYRQPPALDFSLSDGCAIYGGSIRRFAAGGVAMPYGTRNMMIQGVTIDDIAGTAIYDGDVTLAAATETDARARCTGNSVIANTITRAGVKYRGSSSWLRGYTSGSTFSRNRVDQIGWSGVNSGWGWGEQNASPASIMGACTITKNYISNHSYNHIGSDSAAIYTNGREGAACLVQYNYTTNDYGGYPFYVDNGKTQTTYDSNVAGADGTNGTTAHSGYWCAVNEGSGHPAAGNIISNTYCTLDLVFGIAIYTTAPQQTLINNLAGSAGVTPFGATASLIRANAGR